MFLSFWAHLEFNQGIGLQKKVAELACSKKKTAIAVLSKALPTNRRNVTRATENACLHHIKLSSTATVFF